MTGDWSKSTSFETVIRRAGGRAHYNSIRQFHATLRRLEVAKLLSEGQKQSDIAKFLGVHRSTISRDFAALLKSAEYEHICPVCGSAISNYL